MVKVLDTKFYACPSSVITRKTWKLLELVNDTTDADANIINRPFPGSYLEQPPWYRETVRIVRMQRAKFRQEQSKKK